MSSFLAVRALLAEGVPKKEIARRLGLDRRTVRKYAKRADRGDDGPVRDVAPGKLAAVDERVRLLVDRGLSAVQIRAELAADLAAPAVSYSTVQRLVKRLRPASPDVYCRMNFAPGEEAQVDFADAGRVAVGGVLRTMWLFVLTLCFSRRSYYDLVFDQTVPSFLGCLRRGFEFFGGVAGRCKPDNLKSAVLINALGERHYQSDFFRFCRHYRCVPDAARPLTPTDKGRVERDVGYVKTSWLRGKTFASVEDALTSLRAWQRDVADVRIHGTTRRRPLDLFEEERPHLRPLPAEPYEIARFGLYSVRKDCHVHVGGNYYSAPFTLVGKEVLVRVAEREVRLLADDRVVAVHARLVGVGGTSTDPAHYPPTKRLATQELHRRRAHAVRDAGPYAAAVLGRLRDGPYVFADQLAHLARLIDAHGAAAVELACRRALHFDAADSARRIAAILERGLERRPLPDPDPAPAGEGRDFGRPMREYADLLTGATA